MIFHTPRLPHGLPQPGGLGFDTDPLGLPMVPPPATDVLVSVEPGTDAQGIAAAVVTVGATAAPVHAVDHGVATSAPPGGALDVPAATALPTAQPGITLAELDVKVSIAAVSNDPTYTSGGLWGMYGDTTPVVNAFGSQAGEAWARGNVGSTSTIIGVVDTGIDYAHPDLYLNIWLNQGEIPSALRSLLADVDIDGLITFRDLNHAANSAFVVDLNTNGRIDAGDLLDDMRWDNGVDEDRNGYRDDLVGWNFVNNSNNPFDDHGHGTHVSGTIGAVGGNGLGVAGVAWNVQMVPLKFLGSDNRGTISNAVKATDYFTSAASRAVAGENFVATNNSWIGDNYDASLASAVSRAASRDILYIVAAGNGGSDGIGDNNDTTPTWPANLNTQNTAGYDAVISVASITSTGALSGFSNYGSTTVDIAAPGSGVTSTLPEGSYGTWSGTSMAVPHVAGAAALYAALNPTATAAQIKAAILDSAAATPSLSGLVATGGRLDIGALLNVTVPPPPPPPPPATATTATTAASAASATTADRGRDGGHQQDQRQFRPCEGWRPGRWHDRRHYADPAWQVVLDPGGRREPRCLSQRPEGRHCRMDDVRNHGELELHRGFPCPGRAAHLVGARRARFRFGRGHLHHLQRHHLCPPEPGLRTDGNDDVRGTARVDILSGMPASSSVLGMGTRDTLTAGVGNDIFVLGDSRGIFYNDGSASSAGRTDYAVIRDFTQGDRIQLSDDVSDYFFVSTRVDRDAGLGIFADTNGNGSFDTTDELIGIVSRVTSLQASDFIFA